MDALLGAAPDPEVAAALGLSAKQVYKRRKKIGVSAHGRRCKLIERPGAREMLGRVPDGDLAKALGVTRNAVVYYRKVRGIGRCK